MSEYLVFEPQTDETTVTDWATVHVICTCSTRQAAG
jgi:hypothetical protein